MFPIGLFSREDTGCAHRLIGFRIEPQDLAFDQAHPVYTGTPRLLLRVPELRTGELPIEHLVTGAPSSLTEGHKTREKLGYGNSPLPKDAVLVYPNLEGEQDSVRGRPIAHWSGVRAGEYVIIGGAAFGDEPMVHSLIENEIGTPPEGKTIMQHYADVATVKNLSNIMLALREAGFGNQYNTGAKYFDTAAPAPPASDTQGGGFTLRNRDLEACAAMFIPGPVEIGLTPVEQMQDGGFAIQVRNRQTGKAEIRPVSRAFAALHYRFQLTGAPVVPMGSQLAFRESMHPFFEPVYAEALNTFLEAVEDVNEMLRQTYGTGLGHRQDSAAQGRSTARPGTGSPLGTGAAGPRPN